MNLNQIIKVIFAGIFTFIVIGSLSSISNSIFIEKVLVNLSSISSTKFNNLKEEFFITQSELKQNQKSKLTICSQSTQTWKPSTSSTNGGPHSQWTQMRKPSTFLLLPKYILVRPFLIYRWAIPSASPPAPPERPSGISTAR